MPSPTLSPRYRASKRPIDRGRRTVRPELGNCLEARCLLSADVVLEWNQVFLDTFKADRVLPLYFAREAAIVHAAVYDAVNAIDRSYTPLFADVQALARRLARGRGGPGGARHAGRRCSPATGHVRRDPGRRPGGHPARPGAAGHRRGAGRRPADPGLAEHRRLDRDR